MKKFSIVTLSLMLLTGLLFAQGAPMKHKDMQVPASPTDNPNLKDRLTPQDAPMPMMEMLKLSKEQMAKFQDLRLEHQKQMNILEAEVENLKLDIRKMIQTEKFADAKKLNESLYTKKKDMANARIDHIQAMLKELTAEQKEIAKEHFMQMWMQGPKGPGMMRGQGMGCMGQGHMGMGNHMGNCQQEGMPRMQGMKHKMQDCEDCADCKGDDNPHKNKMPNATSKEK